MKIKTVILWTIVDGKKHDLESYKVLTDKTNDELSKEIQELKKTNNFDIVNKIGEQKNE